MDSEMRLLYSAVRSLSVFLGHFLRFISTLVDNVAFKLIGFEAVFNNLLDGGENASHTTDK